MSDTNKKKKEKNGAHQLNTLGQGDNNSVSCSVRIRFGMASILHLTERVADRVISMYDSIFSLEDGDTAKIYMGMGTDLAHDGNGEDALAALSKTLEMQPDNGDAWFLVGLIHLDQQEFEAAVKAFKKARTLGNEGFELHNRLAEAFADSGDYKAASKELKRAVELDPNSAESFFRFGVVLDKLKNYDEAVKAFKKAIDLSPREPAYYQSLGFTMGSLKKHDQAIDYIKRAVELERRRSSR